MLRGAIGSERAGKSSASQPGGAVKHAPRRWGLAAWGARVEAGSPEFGFTLVDKIEVWSGDAARIYAQAAAAQWDPQIAVPWNAEFNTPDEVEDPVVHTSGPEHIAVKRRGYLISASV